MPRKRTTDQSSTETQSQTATDAPELPSEPQPDEIPEQTQSFVERLQQQRGRSFAADPFGIAGDFEAGVRLFENRRYHQMVIKFEEKPSQAVLDRMHEADYRWNPKEFVWTHPIPKESARAARIEAERLYQEVRAMIRHEKGIEAGQEVPF